VGLVLVDRGGTTEPQFDTRGLPPLRAEPAHVDKLGGEVAAVRDEQAEHPAGFDG
jgi:hypothetical protein